MSTSRRLLSFVLVLAGVVGSLRWGTGQVDSDGGLGSVVAYDVEDLDALAECLADRNLQAQLSPFFTAGASITDLSFRRFSQGPAGDRAYVGLLTVGSCGLSFVHYRPGVGQVGTTYLRGSTAFAANARRVIVPDQTGVDFLAYALASANQTARQAYITLLGSAPLTGLRVQRTLVGANGVHYRLELYFDDDTTAPKAAFGADVTSYGFSALVEE